MRAGHTPPARRERVCGGEGEPSASCARLVSPVYRTACHEAVAREAWHAAVAREVWHVAVAREACARTRDGSVGIHPQSGAMRTPPARPTSPLYSTTCT